VVPDLEELARRYLQTVGRRGESDRAGHEAAVDDMLGQLVRRVSPARAERKPLIRLLEAIFIGSTARSGELHRWMYDRWSLADLLADLGFVRIEAAGAEKSRIPGWPQFSLDTDPDGTVYKPGSLYMEADRP
jgi:hypothetical protein